MSMNSQAGDPFSASKPYYSVKSRGSTFLQRHNAHVKVDGLIVNLRVDDQFGL
jgi:hypothetical protein